MSILARSLCLVSLLGLGLEARAQATFPFTLNQPNCNFVWTGTTTFGLAIVGNPSNAFQLLGTQNLDLTFQAGVDPFATGTFSLGGVMSTNGSLHGAAFFGAIPLGTFDINNLTLATTSPSFNLGAGGAFTTDITLTALTGELVFTPSTGTPQSTDISGSTTAPQTVNGNLTRLPNGNFHLVLPVNSSFAFTGAAFSLVGTITGDYVTGHSFCFGDGAGTACPCGNNSPVGQGRGCNNFGGNGALLTATGSASLSNDTLVLSGSGMVPGGAGLYFQGSALTNGQNGVVFGDGLLCLGSIFRMFIKSNPVGSSSYPLGVEPKISVAGDIPSAPAVRYYQLWYRDNSPYCTAATYNLTNALEILWLP